MRPLTAHPEPSVLCRDIQAGRVGAAEVHMFRFKPNPRRMHELLRKTVFQRKISCVVMRHLKQRAFFLRSGARCMHCRRRCSWKWQRNNKKTTTSVSAYFRNAKIWQRRCRTHIQQDCRESMWTMTAVRMPLWGQSGWRIPLHWGGLI